MENITSLVLVSVILFTFAVPASAAYDEGNQITRVMPVKTTYTHSERVSCHPGSWTGYADIQIKVVATIDVQSNNIISIDSYSSNQVGSYQNFVSWTQTSMKVTPNYSAQKITATAEGLAQFSYVDSSGDTRGYTEEVTITYTWDI